MLMIGKRRTARLGSILLSSALLLTVACTNKSADANAAKPPRATPVSVVAAVERDAPVLLEGLGNVVAYNTINLKSRVDGSITKIAFTEGQQVRQGQLLLQIDPRPFQVALEQAQATMHRDQTQLTVQKRNYERYQQLFKEGVVSREQLDQQESQTGALEGTVKADQSQIDNQKLNIAYCRITAPISGRIGLRQVDVGNMVKANDSNALVVITQQQPIAVTFTLPEDSLSRVARAMAHSRLVVDAYNRDDQQKIGSGELLTIDNQIDSTTGTVKLKAVFQNKDSSLWPNQFVNIKLLLETQKNAIVIPAAAVQRGVQGAYVYVLKSDNTVEMRIIKTGLSLGSDVVIDAGLKAGEQVVVDGQDKLQNGSAVQPSVKQKLGGDAHGAASSSPVAPAAHTHGEHTR